MAFSTTSHIINQISLPSYAVPGTATSHQLSRMVPVWHPSYPRQILRSVLVRLGLLTYLRRIICGHLLILCLVVPVLRGGSVPGQTEVCEDGT